MENSEQLSVTLNDSLFRSTSTMVVGEHIQPTTNNISHKSTVVNYGDISIDYSQYYKEAPITFEDLLSDEEGSMSSSSCSDEANSSVGIVEHHTIVQQQQQQTSTCGHEEGSGLRAITYHKYKTLQSCFTAWRKLAMLKQAKAVQLLNHHQLQRGWRAFRWNLMLGRELAKMGVWHHQRSKHRRIFLKWRAKAVAKRQERVASAFYLWRHVTRLKVSCCVTQLVAQRKILHVCWTKWKSSLNMARKKQIASQHFEKLLLRRAFTALLINASGYRKKKLAFNLSQAFYFTILKRDAFVQWKLSLQFKLAARKHYRQVLLTKATQRWHQSTLNMRLQWIQIEGQAQTHYSSQLTRCYFKEWCLKLMEKRAAKFRRSLLLMRFYQQWNSRQTLVQCNKIAATKFHCQYTLRCAFVEWKLVCMKVQDKRVHFELLLQRETLQHYFDHWRSVINFSHSLRVNQQDFLNQHNAGIVKSCFVYWRETAIEIRQRRAADGMYQQRVKKRMFSSWRQFIYQRTLKHGSELFHMEIQRNTLQKYFDRWVCETACRVGENTISDRLFSALCTHWVRMAFTGWHHVTTTSLAAKAVQKNHMRKLFDKWKCRMVAKHTKSTTQMHSADCVLVTKWFRKWRSSLQVKSLARVADKHYNTVCLQKSFSTLTREYKRLEVAKKFYCSVEQSSLVACFVRWRAVLLSRTQLEQMKKSIKFQQHHLMRKCFAGWLSCSRMRQQLLHESFQSLHEVDATHRQQMAWNIWRRQLHCHQIMRNHLSTTNYYCMQKYFYHWKNVAEQSLEMVSAMFIAKFHVSALSTSRNTTLRDSSWLNGFLTAPNITLATFVQYQNSVLSPRASFIRSPVKSSTPLLPLQSTKQSSYYNDNFNDEEVTSSASKDGVKRQLFTEEECANSVKLSPPCKCLNAEVINQLSCLQQDLDNSVHVSESVLQQNSNLSISLNSSNAEFSENIISPPVEFSEHCLTNSHSISVSSVNSKSPQKLKPATVGNSVSELSVSRDRSFVLYNKMVYIIKMMQLYPASVAFIAWRKFVLKMKSLREIQTDVQYLSCQNSVRCAFMLWKSQTCISLEYKQLEMSFLAKQRKRVLCSSLLKWTSLHLKCTRIKYTLDDYLSSKSNYLVKRYFLKWKSNLKMNLRIRNHMGHALLSRCLQSWKHYYLSKQLIQAKIECIRTKQNHTILSHCLMQWSDEAKQRKLLRTCLQCWKNYIQVKGKLRVAVMVIEEKRCVTLKRNALCTWRSMTHACVTVKKLHHRNILRSVFVSWRSFVENKKEALLNHQQEEDRRIVTTAFLHWREFTRKRRLAKQLNCVRILHHSCKKWKHSTIQKQVSVRMAAIDQNRLLKAVFNAWRMVVLTTLDDDDDLPSLDEENRAVLSLCFRQWKMKHIQNIHRKI